MITVQWRVVSMKDGVRKETCIVITGITYGEVSPAYLKRLSAFGQILESELVEYKEEKEQLTQGLLPKETA